jgi:hypothetical protein
VAREDHKHAFPAGAAPSALTVSSTQATGTSASPALADHVHAMPGSATAGASAVGDTAATGTATTVALSDHRHSREAFGTPIVVNGQTTSLATGSLSTLARADHVHTLSNVPVLLASSVLGSNAAILSATSIPSGFSTLHIRWICPPTQRAGQATDAIILRLNSDSGNNYRANASSQSYLVGMGVAGATGLAAPVISAGWVDIFGYASTNYYKQTGHTLYVNADNVNYSVGQSAGGGIWLNTSAVTSVSFSSINGANLSTNTAIYVYGYP